MTKKLTPIKAIRQKCLNCCAYQPSEVRLCTNEDCPLFCYRMGKRPLHNPVKQSCSRKPIAISLFSAKKELPEIQVTL